MPNLGGTPQRKKLDLGGARDGSEASEEEKVRQRSPTPNATRKPPQRPAPAKPIRTTLLDDDDDEDDEDDEIIQASLESSKNKKMDPKIIGALCAVVAVVVVMAFLLLGGKKDEPAVTPPPVEDTTPAPPEETWGNDGLGIQDFSQNTTMNSDSPLTNPDGFVEDISGLTTRVDYTVSAIQTNVVDFVNYTKKRGTWGGGLELYWLDATYKGNQYVVQVPFQYYKELDDEGIVPVKMEVLFIKEANGDTLSIISYMCLDEPTLKTLLKSKK